MFGNLSQFEHNITGAVINYTLVFASRKGSIGWSAQLDITATSYNVTRQQLTSGDAYNLHLQIDVLLGNGSYLRLTSPALSLTSPTCAGKSTVCISIALAGGEHKGTLVGACSYQMGSKWIACGRGA